MYVYLCVLDLSVCKENKLFFLFSYSTIFAIFLLVGVREYKKLHIFLFPKQTPLNMVKNGEESAWDNGQYEKCVYSLASNKWETVRTLGKLNTN